jgi:hypothetical protein
MLALEGMLTEQLLTEQPQPGVCESRQASEATEAAGAFAEIGIEGVEGQPWVPVGSTVGPQFLAGIRGSPQKIRQRWVPVALW